MWLTTRCYQVPRAAESYLNTVAAIENRERAQMLADTRPHWGYPGVVPEVPPPPVDMVPQEPLLTVRGRTEVECLQVAAL